MSFLDRFTGEVLKALPESLTPGRYVATAPFALNAQSRIQPGDALLDDGSGVVRREGGGVSRFALLQQKPEAQAEAEVAEEAIRLIASKIGRAGAERPSPMLPPEMAESFALDELEEMLAETLEEGHLHAISARPRIDLRYEAMTTPVARARRLAAGALTHLASHSDCWERRTLSGVEPRKILARFSEDDYATYENRLYKHLLDRLDRRLARRLAKVRRVNAEIRRALEFEGAAEVHYRLHEAVCVLWGEAYAQTDQEAMRTQGRNAAERLERLLRAIRGLRREGLYPHLPAAASDAPKSHRTNILMHDPHYRRLPPLWEKAQSLSGEAQSPKARLERRLETQRAYVDYVGLVLRRALERYDPREEAEGLMFSWGGLEFALRLQDQDWILRASDEASLTFIPIAWFDADPPGEASPGEGRLLCWPGAPDDESSDRRLAVTPLDLMVVEKMGRRLDEWMLRRLLEGYGRAFGPLPGAAKRLTEQWAAEFGQAPRHHVRLLRPLSAQQSAQFQEALERGANEVVREQAKAAVARLAALSGLCCGPADFTPKPKGGFDCRCRSCGEVWGLGDAEESGGRRFFMHPQKTGAQEGFAWAGRDWLEFVVAE